MIGYGVWRMKDLVGFLSYLGRWKGWDGIVRWGLLGDD